MISRDYDLAGMQLGVVVFLGACSPAVMQLRFSSHNKLSDLSTSKTDSLESQWVMPLNSGADGIKVLETVGHSTIIYIMIFH
ncbi:hypothetical protein BDW62DRAFT_107627 [Aspergillus aurantiobrunneus]